MQNWGLEGRVPCSIPLGVPVAGEAGINQHPNGTPGIPSPDQKCAATILLFGALAPQAASSVSCTKLANQLNVCVNQIHTFKVFVFVVMSSLDKVLLSYVQEVSPPQDHHLPITVWLQHCNIEPSLHCGCDVTCSQYSGTPVYLDSDYKNFSENSSVFVRECFP